MIEKKIQMGDLYAFYGQLLTLHQQAMMELSIYEDLSLGEISELLNITRQAVHDTIRRSEKSLIKYESKLGLVDKFTRHNKELIEIHSDIQLLKQFDEDNKEMKNILSRISEKVNQLID